MSGYSIPFCFKASATRETFRKWKTGDIRHVGFDRMPDQPKRKDGLQVLEPGKIKRGKGGTLVGSTLVFLPNIPVSSKSQQNKNLSVNALCMKCILLKIFNLNIYKFLTYKLTNCLWNFYSLWRNYHSKDFISSHNKIKTSTSKNVSHNSIILANCFGPNSFLWNDFL